MEIIEGLKLHITAEELKNLISKKVETAKIEIVQLKTSVARKEELLETDTDSSLDLLEEIEEIKTDIRYLKGRNDQYIFIADHLLPSATYVLELSELATLDIL